MFHNFTPERFSDGDFDLNKAFDEFYDLVGRDDIILAKIIDFLNELDIEISRESLIEREEFKGVKYPKFILTHLRKYHEKFVQNWGSHSLEEYYNKMLLTNILRLFFGMYSWVKVGTKEIPKKFYDNALERFEKLKDDDFPEYIEFLLMFLKSELNPIPSHPNDPIRIMFISKKPNNFES